jgi:hypothetical protein
MSLSADLISQFAKITKDEKSTPSETTLYGTIVEYNGSLYTKLDGSELLTPINKTTNVKPGERVTVMIKDHTAMVTGNISSPAARTGDVEEIGNKISEFEIIVADKVSTKEFDAEVARIDDLTADNVTIKQSLSSAEATIDDLTADNVAINKQLTANNATIENLKTTKLDANVADIKYATVDDLKATDANIHNLQATYAEFSQTTTTKLEANEANISKLQTDKLDATTADVTYAKISELKAATADITNLEATFGDFQVLSTEKFTATDAAIEELQSDKLSATDIEGKYANIDFSNISEATMALFYANSGLIKDVVIGDGTISGHLIGVTISGDLIEGNTIKAEKLVIKGSDGLYYKLNTDGITTEAEQTEHNSLNGNIIMAKSITATKIAVDDLVAFDATIGGFNITESSIYSGVKSSVDNTTRGAYLDKDGQIAFGDATNFIKYYKDQNGNYKLAISADSMVISSSNKNVVTAINELSESTRTNASDLAAYIASNNKELENLQGQIDGSITTWFYNYVPTVTNIPASEWSTTELKNVHLGDLFYNTITGYCYRWQVLNNVYSWNLVKDVDVTKALADAAKAQSTADTKKRVFVATPIPPYDIGDLWTQGPSGDLMKCQTAKTTGQSYASTDWVKASKYTDDTVANAAQADANALKTRMSSAETEISKNQTEIALRAKKTEVTETLAGYYTKEQSDAAIKVSADNITSSVSNTYATKNALSSTDAKATNAQSTANAAQANINNLEIGGRNLLLNSDIERTSDREYIGIDITSIAQKYGNTGQKLSLSADVTAAIDGLMKMYSLGKYEIHNPGQVSCDIVAGEYTRMKMEGITIDYNENGQNGEVCTLSFYGTYDTGVIPTVKNIKVEIGNRATDWTPAPEDVDSNIANVQAGVDSLVTRVASAETKIQQNSEAITLRATKTEVTTAKSEAISAASADATNKANNALESANTNTANQLKSYSTTAEMNAAIQLKADGITSSVSSTYATKTALDSTNSNVNKAQQTATNAQSAANAAQEDIDNLAIGGRNLYKDSERERATGSFISLDTYDIFADHIGEEVTISFDVMILEGGTSRQLMMYPYQNNGVSIAGSFNFTPTDTWQRFSYTTTVKNWGIQNTTYTPGSIGFYDYAGENNYALRRIKMELGNKATDWTPAPEDMATSDDVESVQSSVGLAEERITTTESLIEQLSDAISMLVTDGNGQSLMTQTANGWTFSTSQIQDIVDTTSKNLDELMNSVEDMDSAVGVLQQAVSDLGVLSEYVKITTYESEPCIELGETDSDFKLLITNTRIMFMQGTGVPAYINNQSLFISKAVVEEELQQGGFVWKARSNGNLGLVWKGVSS